MACSTAPAPFADLEAQYTALVDQLSALGLMYLHVLDHSAMGAPASSAAFKATLRDLFDGPFIIAGGFDAASGEKALVHDHADLVAYGRPFLANPDLPARMKAGRRAQRADEPSFYTPGRRRGTTPTIRSRPKRWQDASSRYVPSGDRVGAPKGAHDRRRMNHNARMPAMLALLARRTVSAVVGSACLLLGNVARGGAAGRRMGRSTGGRRRLIGHRPDMDPHTVVFLAAVIAVVPFSAMLLAEFVRAGAWAPSA